MERFKTALFNKTDIQSANNVIADLCSDLLESGYQFVLTGKLQTDPLERSLTIGIYSQDENLLKQNLEIEDFAVLSTETEAEIQQFVGELNLENFNHLLLSEGARQGAVYIAG